MTDRLGSAAVEDRTLPAVCYALYFLGLTHGLTTFIGVIIAYASRGGAGPRMQTHYTWLIRTFWITLVGMLVGGALILVGIPLSIVIIGIPMMALGGLVCGIAWVWCAVRTALGVIYLARDEAYPRPYAIIA